MATFSQDVASEQLPEPQTNKFDLSTVLRGLKAVAAYATAPPCEPSLRRPALIQIQKCARGEESMATKRQAWLMEIEGQGSASSEAERSTIGRHLRSRDVETTVAVNPGDLVFLWSNDSGGRIVGWGTIGTARARQAAVSDPSRVPLRVQEKVKLLPPGNVDEPFRRHTVARLANEELVKLSVGEARYLSELFPAAQAPELVVTADNQLPRGWLERLHKDTRIESLSSSAMEIIRRAVFIAPKKERRLSSTRILLACLDFAKDLERNPSISIQRDSFALNLVGQALATQPDLASEVALFRQGYLDSDAEVERIGRSVELTANGRHLLMEAHAISLQKLGQKRAVSGDAILAAALTMALGQAHKRIIEANFPIDRFRSIIMEGMVDELPARAFGWQRVFSTEVGRVPKWRQSTTSYRVAAAGHGNDDPWQYGLEDTLGVNEEARAFARLAISKSLTPPLAVGIFGDWGSGKSFFLKLVSEHINSISQGTAIESDKRSYHERVVQIRFNAWHYVDTNLWASLVDHIFVELDSWVRSRSKPSEADEFFDNLSTARELTLEAAQTLMERRREQRLAAESLASFESALAIARKDSQHKPATVISAAIRTFKAALNPTDKKTLGEASKRLGISELEDGAAELSDAISAARESAVDVNSQVLRTLRDVGSIPVILLMVTSLFTVAVVLSFLRYALATYGGWTFVTDIPTWTIAASGLLTSIAMALRSANSRVRWAAGQLANFKDRFDAAVEAAAAPARRQVEAAEAKVAELSAKVGDARTQLASSSEKLSAAAQEFASSTGKRRLLKFVRDRVTSGDYSKHLGLVATIRRDFDELSARLHQGDEVELRTAASDEAFRARIDALKTLAEGDLSDAELKRLDLSARSQADTDAECFDRIVLFIDDLDRCTPEKVVDVLQAVHLLLTFKLFVVFVAVDVRWVRQALEAHYSAMLPSSSRQDIRESAATADDYLEKIFQIPYWVRPMGPEDSARFLADRYARGAITLSPTPRLDVTSDDSAGEQLVPTNRASSQSHSDKASSSTSDVKASTTLLEQEENEDEDTLERVGPPTGTLTLSEAEQAFMQTLSPYVGDSPRRALRFLNVYRLIKASMNHEGLARLEENQSFRILMAQVAIVTGIPGMTVPWLEALDSTEANDSLPSMLLSQLAESKPAARRLCQAMALLEFRST